MQLTKHAGQRRLRRRILKEDIPRNGVVIDATAPIARVVDEIVRPIEAKTVS
jgi:hypothetical protein